MGFSQQSRHRMNQPIVIHMADVIDMRE